MPGAARRGAVWCVLAGLVLAVSAVGWWSVIDDTGLGLGGDAMHRVPAMTHADVIAATSRSAEAQRRHVPGPSRNIGLGLRSRSRDSNDGDVKTGAQPDASTLASVDGGSRSASPARLVPQAPAAGDGGGSSSDGGGGGTAHPTHSADTQPGVPAASGDSSLDAVSTSTSPSPSSDAVAPPQLRSSGDGHCSLRPSIWLHFPKTGTTFGRTLVACTCPLWPRDVLPSPGPNNPLGLGPWFNSATRASLKVHPGWCPPAQREVLLHRNSHLPLPSPHTRSWTRDRETTRSVDDDQSHGDASVASSFTDASAADGVGDAGSAAGAAAAAAMSSHKEDPPPWALYGAQEYSVATFVRDPGRRLRSAYNHVDKAGTQFMLRGFSSAHEALVREQVTTLRQFAEWPGIPGCQTRMLTGWDCCSAQYPWPTQDDVDEAVRRLEHPSMVFVGITDYWDLSIWLFHRKFGGRVWPDELKPTRVGVDRTVRQDAGSTARAVGGGRESGASAGSADGSGEWAEVAHAPQPIRDAPFTTAETEELEPADWPVYRAAVRRFVRELLTHGKAVSEVPRELAEIAGVS